MKFVEFYHTFHQTLQKNYPLREERESLFFLLACYILKREKTAVRLQLLHQDTLDVAALKVLKKGLESLKNNRPIQYISGKALFFDLDWIVDERTLIPRPETEELISWVIENHASKTDLFLLDVGTGSGCIAVSLKNRLPNATVYALDISEDALEVARQNAVRHKVDISFHRFDILKTPLPEAWPNFDVIVSNPPYVRISEKALMHPNVYRYEPTEALFVSDEDPLIFYREIALRSLKRTRSNGSIYFEINQFLAQETALLMEESGYIKIEIRKDIYGNPRMLKARINHQDPLTGGKDD
ncbi:MAG: peptide chain release factor N(5)-glutamine methyltransferase [Flavobacteriales bacterium Tduv]